MLEIQAKLNGCYPAMARHWKKFEMVETTREFQEVVQERLRYFGEQSASVVHSILPSVVEPGSDMDGLACLETTIRDVVSLRVFKQGQSTPENGQIVKSRD